ncbi:MAG: AbrB/MazE/SpoVT family DNA-binding domain-containing protein [Nitrosopumilus sp. H13]|nr:MAG: AbrB/MazE/SpoVT family DNA-binding domain-containing protein [Nitrosopumilus sp. H13]
MEEKRQYVRVLQWRKPSYILTIPPALVLRLGIKLGQGVALDEHNGMLIGIPARASIARKDTRAADRFAKSLSAGDPAEPESTAEDGYVNPLDKLRL